MCHKYIHERTCHYLLRKGILMNCFTTNRLALVLSISGIFNVFADQDTAPWPTHKNPDAALKALVEKQAKEYKIKFPEAAEFIKCMKKQPSYRPYMHSSTAMIASHAEGVEIPASDIKNVALDYVESDWDQSGRAGSRYERWMLAMHACVEHIKPEAQKDESVAVAGK